MVYSGEPIGQPVAMSGPFVMNTKTQTAQALTDFHTDNVGDVLRRARLNYR